jgi:hypothetical protein
MCVTYEAVTFGIFCEYIPVDADCESKLQVKTGWAAELLAQPVLKNHLSPYTDMIYYLDLYTILPIIVNVLEIAYI